MLGRIKNKKARRALLVLTYPVMLPLVWFLGSAQAIYEGTIDLSEATRNAW